jgi:hypothetical protein
MRYFRPMFLGLVFMASSVVPYLQAQSSTPQTYSVTLVSNLTEVSVFSGRESNVKINRNGLKELVEVTLAPQGGSSKGVHMRYLFDFQAHKAYTLDVVTNSCSWMKYVSADAPVNYDPITGSAVMLAETAKAKPNVLGTETINGVPTKVEELVAPGQGKTKIWLAEKGNFIVKLEGVGPDDKPTVNMEIKQLTYGKPLDTLFSVPPNCTTQTQGEWSSTGVNAHAETSVEAQGSGSANLATSQSQGAASLRTSGTAGSQTAAKPAPTGTVSQVARPTQANSRVTEVRLHLVPDSYSGPCPAKVQLVGTITSDGPGTAYYQFQAGAVGGNREGTVNFSGAGTETITSEGQVRRTPQVRTVRFLAGMEPRGHQENAKWTDARLDINCGGGIPPGATGANAGGRQNPPAEAALTAISLPSGTQVEAVYQGTKLEFKPEEQVAFLFAQSIRHLEYDECPHQLDRLCTLEELISGVAGNNGRMIGLARNPNLDPSYRYTLTISGTDYQIAAIPRHPGLGGFLYLGSKGFGIGDFYYNPAGPASTRDESLSEFGHSGEDFRRR